MDENVIIIKKMIVCTHETRLSFLYIKVSVLSQLYEFCLIFIVGNTGDGYRCAGPCAVDADYKGEL